MAVRIKTISNDIDGAEKATPVQYRAHPANKAPHDSRQTNKILELEWEALGKKLNKHVGKESDDIEKLLRQIREKDEQIKNAESRIAELKRQLYALQQKQGNGQGKGRQWDHNKQAKTNKNPNEKPRQQFQKPPQKRHQERVRK
jgi:hypothetical protein